MARAKKYYAYSEMRISSDDGPKTVKVGTQVTKKDLGLSDDEWNHRLKRGIIRTKPYPETIRSGESLRTFRLRQANEAMNAAQMGEDYDYDDDDGDDDVVPATETEVASEPVTS